MSPVNASLVLIVTLFTCCFYAALATNTRYETIDEDNPTGASPNLEQQCHALRDSYYGISIKKTAVELYKKAFALSFSQDWRAAQSASLCAAWFYWGDQHWKIDADNFLH